MDEFPLAAGKLLHARVVYVGRVRQCAEEACGGRGASRMARSRGTTTARRVIIMNHVSILEPVGDRVT